MIVAIINKIISINFLLYFTFSCEVNDIYYCQVIDYEVFEASQVLVLKVWCHKADSDEKY